jgi:hypothetical protein
MKKTATAAIHITATPPTTLPAITGALLVFAGAGFGGEEGEVVGVDVGVSVEVEEGVTGVVLGSDCVTGTRMIRLAQKSRDLREYKLTNVRGLCAIVRFICSVC